MRCATCGSEIPGGTKSCQRCSGSAKVSGAAAAERAAVFAAIEKSAEYAAKDSPERRAALPKISPAATTIPIVFAAIVWILGGGMLALVIPKMMKMLPCLIVVPLGFAAVGVFVFVKLIRWARNLRCAPILARAAIVTGMRTAKNAASSYDYFITCVFADGSSGEYVSDLDVNGRAAEHDAGVLFSQADVAVDFTGVKI